MSVRNIDPLVSDEVWIHQFEDEDCIYQVPWQLFLFDREQNKELGGCYNLFQLQHCTPSSLSTPGAP